MTEMSSQFRFLHDRIQQAAFDSVPDEAKKDFRLHIGRRLMAALSPDEELVPQLDVLSNLNAASELIADEEEKQSVARLNLVAGRRARQALAYQDALGYISVGLDLLGKKAWRQDYDLAFELHSEAFECEYLTANFARAEQLFKALIANARSKLDKAQGLPNEDPARHQRGALRGGHQGRDQRRSSSSASAIAEDLRSCTC